MYFPTDITAEVYEVELLFFYTKGNRTHYTILPSFYYFLILFLFVRNVVTNMTEYQFLSCFNVCVGFTLHETSLIISVF